MTITFEATSKTNLTIFDHATEHEPVRDIDDLMRNRWVPNFAASQGVTLPDFVCVQGSDVTSTINSSAGSGYVLPTYSGLIGTILTAYNTHQNLILRPDDLWITILGQFSAYVNGRAEELRHKFVNHDGQMKLQVTAVGSVCAAPYADMTREFLNKIAANLVDPTLKEWFLPGFSTTTEVDEIVASAAAMCTFQAYFTYTYSLICGIPQITLLGEVDDWKRLREKVDRLLEFDDQENVLSEQWVPLLQGILDEFVESAEHGSQNNLPFWDSAVQFWTKDLVCATETGLTGWLSVLTFFDGQGRRAVQLPDKEGDGGDDDERSPWPRIGFGEINHNVVSCPAKIDDNGTPYNATLYVGQMVYEYTAALGLDDFVNFPPAVQATQNENAVLHTLQPRNDWSLAIDNPEEVVLGMGGSDAVVRFLGNDQCHDANNAILAGPGGSRSGNNDNNINSINSGGGGSFQGSGGTNSCCYASWLLTLLLVWILVPGARQGK